MKKFFLLAFLMFSTAFADQKTVWHIERVKGVLDPKTGDWVLTPEKAFEIRVKKLHLTKYYARMYFEPTGENHWFELHWKETVTK